MATSGTAKAQPKEARRTVPILDVHGTRISQERCSLTNHKGSHHMVTQKRLPANSASRQQERKRPLPKVWIHPNMGNATRSGPEKTRV